MNTLAFSFFSVDVDVFLFGGGLKKAWGHFLAIGYIISFENSSCPVCILTIS